MKKSYFALIAILIVVVLAFTYAKSYLSRLETNDIKLKYEINRRELVDSLGQVYKLMLKENSADLRTRFDSLLQESDAFVYALESQLDLYINPEYDPLLYGFDSLGNTDESQPTPDTSIQDITEIEIKKLTPSDYEIYITYLEMSLDLPRDLSQYEKQVAAREIREKLLKRFSLSEQDLDKILTRIRAHSQKMATTD